MERFTKRNEMNTGFYYPVCFEKCEGLGASYKCNKCELVESVCKKLGEYEDAEEQGLLVKLPCKIGDDVYIIPSKVNFELNKLNHYEENNRVYHQKVELITFTKNGWYIECDKNREYGTGIVHVDSHYKETWFLTIEEAEQAIKKMESEE